MSLSDKIQQDMVSAMKTRDKERLGVLRLMKTAIKNAEIDNKGPLADDDVTVILQRQKKQRLESAEMYRKGSREDLAQTEERERRVIESYLPEALSDSEMLDIASAVIRELGADSVKDMGRVMKETMTRLKATGKSVDGKSVNQIIKDQLGATS